MKKNKKDKNIDNIDIDMHNADVEDDLVIEEEQDLSQKLKKLRDKLKACEEEKSEYLDGWQRSKAEFVNSKKQLAEQKDLSVNLAKEDILISLLPVLDSFEMAFSNTDSLENIDKNWIVGMQNLQTQLINILKEYGIKELNPINEKFDPNKHESVNTEVVEEKKEDGMIMKVVQKGYEINGKVVRAAKVSVGHIK